jgi:hypothetical protein
MHTLHKMHNRQVRKIVVSACVIVSYGVAIALENLCDDA